MGMLLITWENMLSCDSKVKVSIGPGEDLVLEELLLFTVPLAYGRRELA